MIRQPKRIIWMMAIATMAVLCLSTLILLPPAYGEETVTNAGEALISGTDLSNEQEVVEKRTKCSKTYVNPDGTFTSVIGIKPVHFQDTGEGWKEIDTRINSKFQIPNSKIQDENDFDYAMTKNSWHVYFKEKFNEGPVLKYEHGDEWVTIRPATLKWVSKYGQQELISIPQGKKAEVRANTIYYPEAYGSGLDMKYLLVPERIVKELIVKSREDLFLPKRFALDEDAQLELSFAFEYSNGLELYVAGKKWDRNVRGKLLTSVVKGNISFVKDGKTLFYWQSPEFHDSSSTLGEGHEDVYSHSPYSLTQYAVRNTHDAIVSVRVPKTWLDEAVYPVYIDPTFTTQPGSEGKDTYLGYNGGTYNSGAATVILQYGNWQRIGLLEFDLSSITSTATADSATLSLTNQDAETSSFTWEIHELVSGNADWTEGSGTNWNSPAQSTESCRLYKHYNTDYWAANDQTTGFVAADTQSAILGSASQSSPLAGQTIQFDLTASDVQDWFGSSNQNYGMAIRTTIYDSNNFCSSDHGTVSYRPELVVNYTEPNTAPTAPTSLSPADGGGTTDTTPTLSFTQSDPDSGDTVKYRIQIDDTSDFSSVVVDYTSALIAQGATSFTVGQAAGTGTYTVGAQDQTLSDASYYWRVSSTDNSDASSSWATANAGSVAFIVDNVAPTTTFSSTSESGTGTAYTYPNGQTVYFSEGMGVTATQITITVTAADTGGSGVAKVNFGAFNDESAQDDTASPYTRTYNITSTDSAGTISITAYDNADNSDASPVSITMTKDTTNPTAGTLSVNESSSYLYVDGANFYYSEQMVATEETATFSVSGASDGSAGLQYITFPEFFGESAVNDTSEAYSEDYLINNTDTSTGSFTCTVMDNVGNSIS
ncbi:MAG: DNRLRE domain-containing protein, partial [Proteobacteria bacterium]|nr:DNRLRE domain-containing protein [Pseudomonadota bacterium]